MRFQAYKLRASGVAKQFVYALCAVVLAALAGGCSHDREYETSGGAYAGGYAPQPPTFLTGPMAVLLTNAPGYTAAVQVQNEPLGELGKPQTGQLLCRGSLLLYAPNPGKRPRKGFHDPGYSYIWNVAEQSGYVLSEALQGYAPFTSGTRATNVVRSADALSEQTVAGHRCVPERATVEQADGANAVFEECRAKDLGGLPVQIKTAGALPLTVELSKIRPEPPTADIFVLPTDFTKYSSAEAMVDELARRERNLKNKGFVLPDLSEPSSPNAPRPPR